MLYLLHGPDDFTRGQKIAELKEAMGDPTSADMNTTVLNGAGLQLSEIRHHADAMPFLASRRLVILNDYVRALGKKKAEVQPFVDYLNNLPPSTDLVLVERDEVERRHPLLQVINEIGTVQFMGLDQKNLQPWIVNRAKELGSSIDPNAANLLGRLVGLNLRVLNNELDKLSLYIHEKERPIQVADVELLVPYTEDAERFGMSNAIGQRNAQKAYDQLRKELDEGKNPMAILAGIASQVRSLIEVKDMAERGLSPSDIAKAKGWRSDYAAKMRLREAAKFSLPRLESILALLLEFDLAIKTGRIDSLLALDTLIARLCAGK